MVKFVLIAAAAALSGCAGGTSALTGTGDNTASVLGNLQGCHRVYRGSISAGLGAGASGSFYINCPVKGQPMPDEEADPST